MLPLSLKMNALRSGPGDRGDAANLVVATAIVPLLAYYLVTVDKTEAMAVAISLALFMALSSAVDLYLRRRWGATRALAMASLLCLGAAPFLPDSLFWVLLGASALVGVTGHELCRCGGLLLGDIVVVLQLASVPPIVYEIAVERLLCASCTAVVLSVLVAFIVRNAARMSGSRGTQLLSSAELLVGVAAVMRLAGLNPLIVIGSLQVPALLYGLAVHFLAHESASAAATMVRPAGRYSGVSGSSAPGGTKR
jgi:hypothetical protein